MNGNTTTYEWLNSKDCKDKDVENCAPWHFVKDNQHFEDSKELTVECGRFNTLHFVMLGQVIFYF